MMKAKTYTKRTNARRAAIQAGIPDELVEITVHKSGDEVRFGWKAKEETAPTAEAEVTTSKPKKEMKPKVERVQQNGVKRPAPGGLCAAVWEYLDDNPDTTAKQIREVAAAKGWNVNNAVCELYQFRKFAGISGRVKAS
ncbi:MAG: hypothetical protein J5I92_12380 [Thiogranum sp.]|nr:hypothetical protein [Thiogranum sp.]